ncbi:DUF302 domain-containing protein [Roseibium algae]|uniref:DUF302 domain-containing protein n=1 Tax=Roseibium algae TaxID=3123038 RepID=A0ABU8TJU4_9HYPH
MNSLIKASVVAASLSLWMAGVASAADLATDMVPDGVTAYKVVGDFDDVHFGLESAIVNRGLVIDHTSHVGEMLARTKDDVGGTKDIFVKAEALMFCSANLSRKVMEEDPSNIAFCPYVVFAYEAADNPGTTLVGFRQLPETGSDASKQAIGAVNALLDDIVTEAAGE